MGKKPKSYCCDVCDYTSTRKNSYKRHLETKKHKLKTILDDNNKTLPKNGIVKTEDGFVCSNCDKSYKSRSGIYKHIKKCKKNSAAALLQELKIVAIQKKHREIEEALLVLLTELGNIKNAINSIKPV